MFGLWYFASILIRSERAPDAINYLSQDGLAYEVVGADELPDEPSPIMVTDQRGRSKWTISIPEHFSFPLKPEQYRDICELSHDVATHVAELKTPGSGHGHAGHHSYYHIDPNYMDIREAEEHNMLPGITSKEPKYKYLPNGAGLDVGETIDPTSSTQEKKVCERSLTFVLETSSAGLGETLLALWMSYGLAAKEGRAFFVEDRNWAYGSYTTYFQAPPEQSCKPPPRTQRVPCPRHAAHLIVSSATIPWTFGHAFNEEFQDPHKMRIERQEPIFSLASHGYFSLFHLNDEDNNYLEGRLAELNSTIRGKGGMEIGLHVRHGDRHPYEFQYKDSYIPSANYIGAARKILTSHFEGGSTDESDDATNVMMAEMASKILIASDDPAVYNSPEMSVALRAQSQISLAGKTDEPAPDPNMQSGSKPPSFADYTGWEGGFFKDVFWGLGLPTSIPVVGGPKPSKKAKRDPTRPNSFPEFLPDSLKRSLQGIGSEKNEDDSIVAAVDSDRDPSDTRSNPPTNALRLRELVGRAYLLDLAVLGQTDAVVCSVSSAGCRILGIMMGWQGVSAGGVHGKIENKKWWNIDGDWEWRGIEW